ncbi:MAG: EAL domain-containing protein [Gammaproteobacteria bacterium]|jgi:diguanylate cyclase (GGDEF)-like protein/PAS domain S-box-containing protein|nr:EAL domain-containing protein [Gammaproteobacteria bacterium]
MDILGGLIQNASLLLALVLAYSLFIARLPSDKRSTQLLIGLLFGVAALLGMMIPVTLKPGVIFDGRTAVVSMAGLFGGLPAALLSGAIAAAYRAWIGGAGVGMGVATICTASALGALFYTFRRAGIITVSPWTLALFGLLVHLSALAWVVVLPAALRSQILAQVAIPYLTVLPAASLLLGLLLLGQKQRIDNEHALRREHDRMRMLLETVDAIILALDADGRITLINRKGCQLLGYGADELLGKDWFQIGLSSDQDGEQARADYRTRFRQAAAGAMDRSSRIRTRDGRERTIAWRNSLIRDDDGAAIGILSAGEDITDREELHARIEKIAAHIPGVIYQFQLWPDGRSAFPFASKGVQDIFGIDPEQVAEDATPAFERLHADDSERVRASIEHSAKALTLWHDTYRVNLPDGKRIWVEGQASPQQQPDGSVLWHGYIRDVTELKRHEAELERIAHYDPLTGVPNRRLLTDRLDLAISRTKRSEHGLAVCYLDLDGFKPINDQCGHAVGDRFLVKVADSLRRVVREEDTVARLGGDEFVLLLNEVGRPEDCFGLLNRVLAVIREPFRVGEISYSVSASIGVALCPPDLPDPDTLLRHADQAMYRAKDSGKNTYHLYDAEQDKLLQRRRGKVQQLGQAVQDGQLVLHFQPQVDMVSREIIRFEALVRWQRPNEGLVMPGAFLPDIEGTELEVAVDEWVIEATLRQLTDWKALGHRLAVSVNIGARHLLRADFPSRLKQLLDAYPEVDASDLELEILETATLSDFDQAQRSLASCRALGVHFALDDFGTGYSSLAYFRTLPVDVLKIDQSFVRDMLHDPGDRDIVESVVRLSNAFNRSVVAEGVETLAHAALLTWLGCRFGQGYGIARPMPGGEVLNWVAGWSAETGWNGLGSELDRDDLHLMVVAQNHRCWLQRVLGAAERSDTVALSELVEIPCDFGAWCTGVGRERYQRYPEFQSVVRRHDQVHQLASRLSPGDAPEAQDLRAQQLAALGKASDLLLAEIGRLIAHFDSTAPAPSRAATSVNPQPPSSAPARKRPADVFA